MCFSDWAASEDRSEKLAAGSGPIACGVDATVDLMRCIESVAFSGAGVQDLLDLGAPGLAKVMKRGAPR